MAAMFNTPSQAQISSNGTVSQDGDNSILPKQFDFSGKPNSAYAETVRMSVAPTSGPTASGGDKIIFSLPCGQRGSFLNTQDSYLQFTVTNRHASNDLYLDGCAASVIRQIDVYAGSVLISSITNYALLHNLFLDFQVGNDVRRTSMSTQGCGECGYGVENVINKLGTGLITGGSGTTPTITSNASFLPGTSFAHRQYDRVGYRLIALGSNGQVSAPDTTTAKLSYPYYNSASTFAIPLLGVIGSGSDKALPLGLLAQGSELRIEVTLNPYLGWGRWMSVADPPVLTTPTFAASTDPILSKIVFQATYVRLTPQLTMNLLSECGGQFVVPTTDFVSYQTLVPVGSSSVSWNIPCRVRSARCIFIVPQRSADTIPSAVIPNYTARTFLQPNASVNTLTKYQMILANYSFRVGAQRIPSTGVDCSYPPYSEARQELLRCFQLIGGVNSPSVINGSDYYLQGTPGVGGATPAISTNPQYSNWYGGGGFAIGQSLESFGNLDQVMDGLNLAQSGSVLFEANFGYASEEAFTLTAFVMYDSILSFSPDGEAQISR
jgi:hypothetical protein